MLQGKTRKIIVLYAILILFFFAGCQSQYTIKENEKDYFYNYNSLSSELEELENNFSNIISVQTIGETYEGREIFIIRITGDISDKPDKPGLLAIFTEHSAEHLGTSLAMGLTNFLVENYGKDQQISNILDNKEIYIVPMMNPDGVEYDLSGSVTPFSWRKNRRPTGEETYGVDLNRNWGHKLNIPVSKDLAKDLSNKESRNYAGEEPFSEKETQAVRDFLLSRSQIKLVVDYHTGGGGLLQGMIMVPVAALEDENLSLAGKTKYLKVAEQFAEEMNVPDYKDPPFIVHAGRNAAETMRPYLPWYIKPFFPKTLPYAPGFSTDWIYGELGIMAFGVEAIKPNDFFKRLPESKTELVNNQVKGFLYLLEILSENPF